MALCAEESDAGPARLPDLTEDGSERRVENRGLKTRNTLPFTRGLGSRQGFVDSNSCNVARAREFVLRGDANCLEATQPRKSFGPGFLVLNAAWCMVHGAWSIISAWSMEHGAQGMEHAQHGEQQQERRLVQCLIGRLAEKISASGRRDPRSRKVRAPLLPITAAQAIVAPPANCNQRR